MNSVDGLLITALNVATPTVAVGIGIFGGIILLIFICILIGGVAKPLILIFFELTGNKDKKNEFENTDLSEIGLNTFQLIMYSPFIILLGCLMGLIWCWGKLNNEKGE